MGMYDVNQKSVSSLLGDIESDNIAIPEMQRPFVWTSKKVRDLMDSLYRGYPVGYLITWQSSWVPVKGGGSAGYKQILIDGQQRTTALRAAVAGETVMTKDFQNKRIVIAFNPLTEEFATATPFIVKDSEWISDISEFLKLEDSIEALFDYLEANPGADRKVVGRSMEKLRAIKSAQIGVISLNEGLDIETVTEIFTRINSKGVPLSSADFVMSKISAYGEKGRNLRKLIDYFAHLAVNPGAVSDISNDHEFTETKFWPAISWLKDDTEDLYDPSYVDIIRVAGLVAFNRGRPAFVVRELSGLNPETRKFEPQRIPAAYQALEDALLTTVRRYHFEHFITLLKSAGFIDKSLISSTNAVNFAYALYLILRAEGRPDHEIDPIVRRWFVLMLLTGRASASFETTFESDLSRVKRIGAEAALREIESAELSDAFWNVGLPQRLNSSAVNNSQFRVFQASQVKQRAHGFLSKHITVQSMIEQSGDIHHLVPKDYLRKNGINDKRDYNQVANYALTETQVNVRIGNRQPAEYMSAVEAQINNGALTLGEISTAEGLAENLKENAIPASLKNTTYENYEDFLNARRQLMSQALKEYYFAL
ncbi:DUF262 domain-containing protein [Corynebacterium incognita]|uniref:DUF262 domain-containing protein n=1 Tax=Corynebacterium incognita TaxID=2754725 RepID=A0A7G7CN52_9CORY|nr:DUF262 domain-containing protein [Corynebacterium incognita]